MFKITKKKALVAGIATVVVVGGASAALAYWTTSGSGDGTASTSAGAANLTVTQVSAPSNMAPGVAAGGVSVKVTNGQPNTVQIDSVTVSIQSVTGGAGSCDPTDYTLSNATMTNGAGELTAAGFSTFSGATLGFNDKPTTNQDGCKGATVNLHYVVNSA
jgi:hypothetical protein